MSNQNISGQDNSAPADQPQIIVPKGYKQSEVGIIPEDWEVVTLGECSFKIASGRTKTNSNGIFPLYGSTGLIGSCQNPDYSGEALLIARVGANAGKLNFVQGKYGVSDNTIWVIIKPDYSIYYLMQCLLNKNLNHLVFGSGQPLITGSQLKKIFLPAPTKKEQAAIANALSDIDALISEQEKLVAKKQAIKAATMQQLLTGRTRLPQFALRQDGTAKGTKPSELGKIPEDWVSQKLGALGCTYGGLAGKTKSDFGQGNAHFIPFTNILKNISVDMKQLEKVNVFEMQNEVQKNDLLFNGSSEIPEEVCFSSVMMTEIEGVYLNSFCFGFRAKNEKGYNALFLAYWFRSEIGRKAISIMAQGSTRYNISKSQFLKMHITLPSLAEQNAIATILSDMDEDIAALQERLDKTRQIKQGMMQQLLTGKIRLKF